MTLAEAIETPRSDVPTLRESSACVDCDSIFRRGSSCPYCGSESLMNLAEMLNRGNQSAQGGDPATEENECSMSSQ